jgi:hypothetical protein
VTRARRRIGPIGTGARVAGGLAAVVLPAALAGVTWWDLGVALLALPLTAVLVAAAMAGRARGHGRRGAPEQWIRSSLALSSVIAVEVALTYLTPLDGATAIWIFIGVSLLVAALRGDAACEAVAIPNAIAGRKDPTGCVIYSPIDAIEARRSPGGPRPVPTEEVHG